MLINARYRTRSIISRWVWRFEIFLATYRSIPLCRRRAPKVRCSCGIDADRVRHWKIFASNDWDRQHCDRRWISRICRCICSGKLTSSNDERTVDRPKRRRSELVIFHYSFLFSCFSSVPEVENVQCSINVQTEKRIRLQHCRQRVFFRHSSSDQNRDIPTIESREFPIFFCVLLLRIYSFSFFFFFFFKTSAI